MRSTKTWSRIALLATGLAFAACAAKQVPTPPAPTVSVSRSQTPGGGTVEQIITATAAVQAIDLNTRKVTLRLSDGETTTIKVSDEVRNLDQVKRGDLVTIAFFESIAYHVLKKGTAEPGVSAAADAERAPVGARPGAAGGAAITVTATITAIDKTTNTVSLKGPEGNVVKVKVQDPSRLEGVKVGDLVEITYTEAIAVSVEKAAAK
jgi:Cu/Ag efflux protein CusF